MAFIYKLRLAKPYSALSYTLIILILSCTAKADNAVITWNPTMGFYQRDAFPQNTMNILFGEESSSSVFYPAKQENIIELGSNTTLLPGKKDLPSFVGALSRALSITNGNTADQLSIIITTHGSVGTMTGYHNCRQNLLPLVRQIFQYARQASGNPIINLLYDACYSGSIIELVRKESLRPENRNVRLNAIASVSAQETSYSGFLEDTFHEIHRLFNGNIPSDIDIEAKLQLLQALNARAQVWSTYIPESQLQFSSDQSIALLLNSTKRNRLRPETQVNLMRHYFKQLAAEGRTISSELLQIITNEWPADFIAKFFEQSNQTLNSVMFSSIDTIENFARTITNEEIKAYFYNLVETLNLYHEQYNTLLLTTNANDQLSAINNLINQYQTSRYNMPRVQELIIQVFQETNDNVLRNTIASRIFDDPFNFRDLETRKLWLEILSNPAKYSEEIVVRGYQRLFSTDIELNRLIYNLPDTQAIPESFQRILFKRIDHELLTLTDRDSSEARLARYVYRELDILSHHPEWIEEAEFFNYLRLRGRHMDRNIPFRQVFRKIEKQLAAATDDAARQRYLFMAEMTGVRSYNRLVQQYFCDAKSWRAFAPSASTGTSAGTR